MKVKETGWKISSSCKLKSKQMLGSVTITQWGAELYFSFWAVHDGATELTCLVALYRDNAIYLELCTVTGSFVSIKLLLTLLLPTYHHLLLPAIPSLLLVQTRRSKTFKQISLLQSQSVLFIRKTNSLNCMAQIKEKESSDKISVLCSLRRPGGICRFEHNSANGFSALFLGRV